MLCFLVPLSLLFRYAAEMSQVVGITPAYAKLPIADDVLRKCHNRTGAAAKLHYQSQAVSSGGSSRSSPHERYWSKLEAYLDEQLEVLTAANEMR